MEIIMDKKKELKGLLGAGILLLALFILGFYGAETHKESLNILSEEEISIVDK